MRVTEPMLYRQSMNGIAKSREQYATASEQSSSGLRVEHAWDDPSATSLILQQNAQKARQAAISEATARAGDETTFSEAALDSVNTSLQRAQELAVQLANSTYSANDRVDAANEVDQILSQVAAQGNARFGNVYVFGGDQTGAPPFDSKGTYSGDSNVRQVEIAPGISQAVSVAGDAVFKGANGGIDLTGALTAFSNALKSNNVAGIQTAINDLATGISQISAARSQLGASGNVFSAASTAAKNASDSAEKERSNLQDADAFDSASALAQAEQSLQATITAASKQLQAPTLADKL
jgi:flagellin-like hook-associated protein FlgL